MAKVPINDDPDETPDRVCSNSIRDDGTEPAEPSMGEPMAGGAASDELTRLRAERDDLFERLARATADFKNAQKRLHHDKEQAVAYANSSLIKHLLPVIDNFERALGVDEIATDVPSLLKGMQIVHDQWLKVLESHDVVQIAPKSGEPFDPHRQQALMQQDRPDLPANSVSQLLHKGYEMHGRVLRPAGVAVSRAE